MKGYNIVLILTGQSLLELLSFISIFFLTMILIIRLRIVLKEHVIKAKKKALFIAMVPKEWWLELEQKAHKDNHCASLETGSVTDIKKGKTHPLSLSYNSLTANYKAYTLSLSTQVKPRSYFIASKNEE